VLWSLWPLVGGEARVKGAGRSLAARSDFCRAGPMRTTGRAAGREASARIAVCTNCCQQRLASAPRAVSTTRCQHYMYSVSALLGVISTNCCQHHSVSARIGGRFLIRPCDLVGGPRGRSGPFFCLPGSWQWWAPGGTSHQVGWSGEARGPRGGATGGAVLTFAPGRAAGGVFFPGG
jgi:hypothetical protein